MTPSEPPEVTSGFSAAGVSGDPSAGTQTGERPAGKRTTPAHLRVGLWAAEFAQAQRFARDLRWINIPDLNSIQSLMPQAAALLDMLDELQVLPAQQASVAQQAAVTISALERIALSGALASYEHASWGSAFDTVAQFTELRQTMVAASTIQMLTASTALDVSALMQVAPTRQMVADVVALTNVQLDYDHVMSRAFGFPALTCTAVAATAAQVAVAEADSEADLESVASEAILGAAPADVELDAPPTSEQVTAFEALRRLVVILRPNLRDEPRVAQGIAHTTAGASFALLGYLATVQPGLLAVLLDVAGMASIAQLMGHSTRRLLVPPQAVAGDERG